jgi:hypothetical protein
VSDDAFDPVDAVQRGYDRLSTLYREDDSDCIIDNDYIALAATATITQFLQTFVELPPLQRAASFTIDQAVAKLGAVSTSGQ